MGPYGENIVLASAPLSPAAATKYWVDEKNKYDYDENKCINGGECRHYTGTNVMLVHMGQALCASTTARVTSGRLEAENMAALRIMSLRPHQQPSSRLALSLEPLLQHGSTTRMHSFNPRPSSPTRSPASSSDRVLSCIKASGVIACLHAPSPELALGCARAALDGGISALEIVASTPGVFDVLSQLVLERPCTTLGVGTVLSASDAEAAIDAGAKFLMSPAFVVDVLRVAGDSGVVYIPGVMTPTEILWAHGAGGKMVKVYPVSALGGTKYIAAIRKPFPHIPLIASQGITMDVVGDYIAAGATAVVLSDAIFDREAVKQGDFDRISVLAGLAASMGYESVNRVRSSHVSYLDIKVTLISSEGVSSLSVARIDKIYPRDSWYQSLVQTLAAAIATAESFIEFKRSESSNGEEPRSDFEKDGGESHEGVKPTSSFASKSNSKKGEKGRWKKHISKDAVKSK
ncbi:KHG/KDPG aldolase-like protein [Drosera capensis]